VGPKNPLFWGVNPLTPWKRPPKKAPHHSPRLKESVPKGDQLCDKTLNLGAKKTPKKERGGSPTHLRGILTLER